ncbi:MAG: glycoside hydrolase family 3 C-terminal domain-containing protein, partial [Solirubrobacterales bacterium]|nr:glycoside hydrolase family 3 C-terminal domain-containing protein [Solirubrobacterales bacterium]
MAALVVVGALAGPPVAAHAEGRCGEAPARPWCDTGLDADTRAGLLLEALTPAERIGLLAGDELTGVAGAEGTHTGTSDGVPRLGLPTVLFSDGPVGPRQGMSTAMPSPMSLASTFSGALAEQHAAVVGDEAKKKGNDVVFAPAVNMLRTPLNGRTFEYFGEDPYLTGRMAFSWTRGLQAQGVIGNVKHFAVNNQEGAGPSPPGSPLGTAVIGGRLTVDARVDERTLREIYTPQFEQAVKAGVGTVMCAYPRVGGQYACENEHLLQDILRRDFGFKGFVLTDYGAAKNTGPSLNNGLDLDIWPGVVLGPAPVTAALIAGLTSERQVDRSVRRILRTLFAFGFFDRAAYVDDGSQIDRAGHHQIAGSLEEQGAVLLKNAGDLLPLDPGATRRVAVIGPEATVLKNGGGSSAIVPFTSVTPLAGIQARIGAEKVSFDDGSDPARAAAVARAADVAVVVVGDRAGEGADKPDMGLNAGQIDGVDRDALVAAVGAAQPRTVVVMQTGGPVLTPWRDAVPALLEAWFPGQNGGTAIARVLFGDTEPGGRLPATFPLREADEPVSGDLRRYPGVAERVDYEEGVLIGYRWFDAKGLDVAYPFGHGLSYTSFAFSDLRLEPGGGEQDAVVSAVVTNTGKRTGTAVPQLYLGLPEPRPGVTQPPLQLKGFERVTLPPGGRRRVRFPLDERAFSFWDTRADGWRVAPGCYGVAVGASSRELALRGTIARGATCAA